MSIQKSSGVVLALYPNRIGLAYALFNSEKQLLEYGMNYVQPVNNKKLMQRVRKYLDYYKPDVVLLRDVQDIQQSSKRSKKLLQKIKSEADQQGLKLHQYTRSQIQQVFEVFEITTKYEISKKLMEWYPELRQYAYHKRKQWMSEHHNTAIFDAASLAVVLWYLER